jgi:caffeoyl-CoA O-methyltransferase
VSDRAEVRVGKALDLLPQLVSEAPFDLVFIDADKPPYPQYLDWALRLTRPGSIIVADNCIRGGKGLREPTGPEDEYAAGIVEYNRRIANDPRLVSLALAMDDDYSDGFAIAVVRS